MYTDDVIARFWSKVDKSGDCWLWKAARTKAGYGVFTLPGRKLVYAHRFAEEIENGPIPEGIVVLHICDNPPCIRHRMRGTPADNNRDMFTKGRGYRFHHPSGADHWSAKHPERVLRGDAHYLRQSPGLALRGSKNSRAILTESQAVEIRHLYGLGSISQAELAQQYGVSPRLIFNILHRRAWKHV